MKKYIQVSIAAILVFCSFLPLAIFAQCSAPVINSFSPNTGYIGSTVTINGAFFDPTPANNQVFFGATRATILTASFGKLTVTVPVGASTAPISVKNGCNLTGYSPLAFNGIFCETPVESTSYNNTAFTLPSVGAYNMLLQDLDGDGKPDVVSAYSGITVARNTSTVGTLSFTRHDFGTAGGYNSFISTADFDGDGKRDLFGTQNFYRNTSTGPGNINFDITASGFSGYQNNVGDFNNDGKIDVVIGNGGSLSFYRNTSSGPGNISFQFAFTVNVTYNSTGIQCADLDGDGKVDVLATQGDGNRLVVLRNTTSTGATNFSFASVQEFSTGGGYPYRCAIADFDKDGKIDLATVNYYQGLDDANTAILRNTSTPGNINFATANTFPGPNNNYRIAVGDVDGDGYPDIVTKSLAVQAFAVYKNTSSGPGNINFANRNDYSSAATAEVSGLVIGDFDGDYVPDIATSGINSNEIRFHRNTSSQADVTPPTALCKNIIVALSPTGMANVTASMIDNGSSDACGIGSLLINGQASINYTCADVGPNNVVLTVKDRAGNTSTCNAVVTVAPAAIIASGQTTVCQGQTVLLSANQGDTYQWLKDGNAISGATNQTYTASVTGNYSVTVTNAGGCSGTSASTPVNISAVSQATATPSGSTSICQGNSVTITASSGSAYSWSNGANSQSITVSAAGSYSVTIYDANGCSSTSAPVVVTIKSGALPNATITSSGSTTFCSGGSIDLSVNAASSYLWNNGATTQSINVTQGGSYSVKVTNADGCFVTSSPTSVVVKPIPSVNAGNDVTICANPTQLKAVGNSNGSPTVPQVSKYCFYDAPGGSGNCNFTTSLCSDGYDWLYNESYTQNITAPAIEGLNFKLYYTCSNVTFTFRINGNVLGTSDDPGLACDCNPGGVGTYPKTVSFTKAQVAAFWTGGNNVVTVVMNSGGGTALAGIVVEVLTPGEIYSWSPAAGLSNPNIANPVANPASTTNYTVTYTSSNGCTATDQVLVSVVCNQPPVANCQPVAVFANANCQGTATPANFNAGSTDPDGDPITFSVSPAGPYSLGVTNVTFTVSDNHGASSTCQTTITVSDNTPPSITCPAPLTVQCASEVPKEDASLIAATDNCSGVITKSFVDDVIVPGSCANKYTINRTYKATDASGNSSTCTQVITVNDNTAPVISCPANMIVNNTADQCGAIVNFAATATDNCSGAVTITYSKDPGTFFNVGTTSVNATATDICGNSSSCSFTVTLKDAQLPVINNLPVSVVYNATQGTCFKQVSWTAPTASDNCGVASIVSDNADYNQFGSVILATGVHTITYTATDVNGNVTTASFTITIKDTQAPVITGCPANIVQNASNGACDKQVFWNAPTASDNCTGVSFVTDHLPGDLFPVGVTTVTYTATDNANNVSTCSFTITIVDNQNPVISCPANISVSNDLNKCGAFVDISPATSTDNCGVQSVVGMRSDNLALTADYPVGLTTITWTATDVNGRTSSCQQTVRVRDAENPVITCPSDISVNNGAGLCGANINIIPATASDNCPGVIVSGVRSDNQALNALYPIGQTTITWTATDAYEHQVTCTQNIMVSDNENPVISCGGNISHTADAGLCSYSFLPGPATATDNCPGVVVSGMRSDNLALNAPYPSGMTTITWTATDIYGHSATCNQTVTVTDNERPVVTCPADQSVDLNATCGATLPDYRGLLTVRDNCTAQNALVITQTPAPGTALSGTGTLSVSFTVTDASNNSSSCSITVTKRDVTPPSITCPSPIAVNNDNGVCGAVVSFGQDALYASSSTGLNPGSLFSVNKTTGLATLIGSNGTGVGSNRMTSLAQDPTTGILYGIIGGSASMGGYLLKLNPATGIGSVVGTLMGSGFNGSPGVGGADALAFTSTGILYSSGWSGGFSGGSFLRIDKTNAQVLQANSIAGYTEYTGLSFSPLNGSLWASRGGNSPGRIHTVNPANGSIASTLILSDGNARITDLAFNSAGVLYCSVGGSSNNLATINTTTGALTIIGDFGPAVQNIAGLTFLKNASGGISATDNCSSNISITQTSGLPSGSVFPVGVTTNTFVATDASGNSSTCSFTVTVTDNEKPKLVGVPANTNVECSAVPSPANVTATDNCANVGAVQYNEVKTNGNCPGNYTLTRTWSVTDAHTNTQSASQVITVRDTQAPILSAAPASTTVSCEAVPMAAVLTATDNCDASPVVVYTQNSTQNTNPSSPAHYNYTLTRTWTATDHCNNVSSKTQTITVQDVTKPMITCPASVTVSCQDDNSLRQQAWQQQQTIVRL